MDSNVQNGDEHMTTCCTVCNGCGFTKKHPQKYAIVVLTSLWGFFTNVERAIILPTMWLYFTTYWSEDTAKKFYGATMAAFNLSVLLFTPAYAFAAHKGIPTKYLLIFANHIEILGNLAYLIARQPWVVLAGRFISGIGGSCDTPMYADLARTTKTHERTPYMTVTYVCKQLGLIFGPVCTLMMHKLHWTMGDFTLSVYNGPGLLMAILWVVHTLLVIFFYPKVAKSNQSQTAEESKKLLAPDETDNKHNSCCPSDCSHMRPYGKYVIMSIFIMIFAAYFCVMSLETVLPPMVNRYFNWDEVRVSYVYLGASFLLIIMCIILHCLSKRVEDRVLALVGFILLNISYFWLMFATAFMKTASVEIGIPILIAGVAIHVIGMPLALAVTEALYTKLVPPDDLDRALSYLRCVSNIAFLLGPLEGGIYVDYGYLVFLGNFLICLLGLGLLSARYSLFRPETQQETPSVSYNSLQEKKI